MNGDEPEKEHGTASSAWGWAYGAVLGLLAMEVLALYLLTAHFAGGHP